MGLGIISGAMAAGAIGGLGEGMQSTGQLYGAQALEDQRNKGAMNLMQIQSDLAQHREQALEQFKSQLAVSTANQQRQAQVDRINGALSGVAQGQADQTFADHDAALSGNTTSGTSLTPEQQRVIQDTTDAAAANKADYKSQLMHDPHSYILAAMKTGDITPEQVAQLVQQQDAIKRQENAQKMSQDFQREQQKDQQVFQAGQQDKQIAATRENMRMTHMLDPETIETNAQAIATGKLPPLTGIALRSPSGAATMARVLEINPEYSAKDYATGAKAEKDFATGKQGNMVRSFNVALSHLDTLSGMATALKNGDIQAFNKVGNFFASQTGAAAPTNFEAVKHIVGDEIVKAVTGGAGALGDREAAAKVIDAANSPAQLQGIINSYKELMAGQLNGLRDQYAATTGRNDFDTKYLSGAAHDFMATKWQHGASNTGTPSAAPATGAGGILTYDPATGTFH